jgi:hypothetical protein
VVDEVEQGETNVIVVVEITMLDDEVEGLDDTISDI